MGMVGRDRTHSGVASRKLRLVRLRTTSCGLLLRREEAQLGPARPPKRRPGRAQDDRNVRLEGALAIVPGFIRAGPAA